MAKRNKPKSIGGQSNMLQQFQRVQQQMEEVQNQLADETITATVGGGAIKIVMTGDQRVVSVAIDPGLLEDADVEMLQDLIVSGVNTALEQSRNLQSERMGPLAGGLSGLPF
jgi:DNA-binding YbaB/EbfC family protein